jgi:type II secretory pathway component GspD/PulD (secretin)
LKSSAESAACLATRRPVHPAAAWSALAATLALMLAAPVAAVDATTAVTTNPSTTVMSDGVRQALDLKQQNRTDEAIKELSDWCDQHPDDSLAQRTLIDMKVEQQENLIRTLLTEQAMTKQLLVGDPDYETAKARANVQVQNRLDVAEYLVGQRQYGDAVLYCNGILKDYPSEPAVLQLKFRILETLVARERDELLKEQEYRHGEGINDVIRDDTFPRDPPKIARTVWIFDEDIDAEERARIDAKLQEKVTMIYDGTNGTKSTPVREVLGPLFSYVGINYVILDQALGDETLTIHLVDESVGTALATIAKLVKVRFNYSGGTVFVTNSDNELLTTEIIHLESGLTNVAGQVEMASLDAAGAPASTPGSGNGNGAAPAAPAGSAAAAAGAAKAAGGGAQQQGGQTDLEKFLDKVPDLIVGWPADGRLYVERKSNTLYVRSTPSTIAELRRLLHSFDYNNVQVLIEARFIEVSEDAARELGVDWAGGGQKGAVTVAGPNYNPLTPGTTLDPATIGTSAAALAGNTTPPNNGAFAQLVLNKGLDISAKLTALEQNGKATTLSEPKILTLNNSQGVIKVSTDVAYVSGYQAQSTSTNSTTSGLNVVQGETTALVPTYQVADTGIELKIKPSIARNSDVITLEISPVVKELTALLSTPFQYPAQVGQAPLSGNIQQPEFSTRSLSTTMHVENGQTVALGGLTSEDTSESTAGTPFLMNVPLLGHLFRRDSRSSQRKNLVILVTAHIVDPNGSKLSDDIRRLRDTARVIMPPEVIDDAAKAAAAAAANPVTPPPAKVANPPQDSPWRPNGK